MIDLIDLPFNVVHTLYKNALQTAIAQKEKEEQEAKERAEAESRERAENAREARRIQQSKPMSSTMPMKQPNSVQMPSKSSDENIARINDATMSDFEDLF